MCSIKKIRFIVLTRKSPTNKAACTKKKELQKEQCIQALKKRRIVTTKIEKLYKNRK